jgi:signal transduction histidine kinase
VLVVQSRAFDQAAVAVAVRDSGMGLDPAHRGQVFDAFFTTKPDGIGMGLAICKSIVQSHGGEIAFHPNVDGGTTFQLTLPGIPENTP